MVRTVITIVSIIVIAATLVRECQRFHFIFNKVQAMSVFNHYINQVHTVEDIDTFHPNISICWVYNSDYVNIHIC